LINRLDVAWKRQILTLVQVPTLPKRNSVKVYKSKR
jgi:hypothetical protein